MLVHGNIGKRSFTTSRVVWRALAGGAEEDITSCKIFVLENKKKKFAFKLRVPL